MSIVNRRKPTQAESLGAGIIAGAVEGFVTYPAEFVKTKAQFSRSSTGEVSSIDHTRCSELIE
jgi:solute carrier family 25 citrate transporter 1